MKYRLRIMHKVKYSNDKQKREDQKESRGTCKTSNDRRDGSPRTTWNTTGRKLTWGDIWKYEPLRFSFCLRSVYVLLPSPANLCRWGLSTDPNCCLCDKPDTLEHVLSSCSTADTRKIPLETQLSPQSWLTGWRS